MANNIQVTAGSGTTLKTTDTAGVHVPHHNVDSSALPTGAATSANQTTVIGHLDGVEGLLTTIDADTSALAGAISGTEVQVDVVTSALPTGAATAANQSTIIGHVDGIEALLTTIDADTSALAGAVSGTEVQVDIVSAPTLTVNAHAVTNAGTFAVQVDGAALTALQLIDDAVFAEDTAAQAADKGIAVLAVRRDADTTMVGTDNDYANLQVDANGRLKVEAFSGETLPVSLASVPSHAVTNAGTFAVQVDGSALTALQLIDNSAVNHDAAASAGTTQIGLEARTTDGTAVASGDAVRALATILGKQVVKLDAVPDLTWSYAAASGGITNTTAVTIKAAAGVGVRNYLKSINVVNGHATVSTEVLVRDGSAGTVLHRGYAYAAGGGYALTFDPPLRGTANTLLEVVNVTTGSATYVNASGYTAAE